MASQAGLGLPGRAAVLSRQRRPLPAVKKPQTRVSRQTATCLLASGTPTRSAAAPQQRSFAGSKLAQHRRAAAHTLHEATSSDRISVDVNEATTTTSNGVSSNGVSSNGVYSSNGAARPANGAYPSTNGAYAASNGASPSSNGASKVAGATAVVEVTTEAAALKGRGTAKLTAATPLVTTTLEEELEGIMGSCDAGQLEACAQERITEMEVKKRAAASAAGAPATVAGTPYQAPGGRWSSFRNYSTFQRTFSIWSFALVFAFKYWLMGRKFSYGRAGMNVATMTARKQKLAAWLREGLVKLGPTFIKIGQQFSTRVDVLSPEFVKELEKLQDNVPAFDSRVAIQIVENGLGGPINSKFEEFTPEPIAAASLGQVHLAKIDGVRVVVKVQRPGLKELFDIDLKNIRVLAQWLQKLDPQSDGAARDWVAIYDECSRILYQEIDYVLEGQNADRFRKNFAAQEWVKVPKIVWPYTTSQVLTMEYAPGVKINRTADLDALGVDRKRLARLTVESYLQQLLTHGFFHADPHPGNIAVDAEGGGRLIYYDFGMMGSIPNDIRGGLLELFYGVYEKDPDKCIDALIMMGVLVPGGDRVAVRRTADFFLTQFQARLDAQKQEAESNPEYSDTFKPGVTKEERQAKRKAILASIGEDLLLASADKPFRFPATFTFVVRSFTVLDGIGKGLDPRFDISEIAAPYARSLLLEGKPQLKKLRQEFAKRSALQNRAVKNLFRGPNMIEDINGTMTRLERGDLKLRVRALEAERALARVTVQQKMVTSAVVASTLVNMGTVLSVSAMGTAATLSFVAAGVAGLSVVAAWLKVRGMEKKELQITGAA